jgi:hypothetical protein
LAKHRVIIRRQDDFDRSMLKLGTKLYNGSIFAAGGNSSQDGHCKGKLLLAWPPHEKEISHGKMGYDGYPEKAVGVVCKHKD